MYVSAAARMPNTFELISSKEMVELLKTFNWREFKFPFKGKDSPDLSTIIDAHKSDNLVIVLGAGVSMDYGLPSWNTLLHTLMSRSLIMDAIDPTNHAKNKDNKEITQKAMLFSEIFNDIFCPSPLIAGRYLSNAFGDSGEKFEREIQKILYANVEKGFTSPLIKELVQLCAAPGRSPCLDSIISYNFDDILEDAIWKASVTIPIRPIYSIGQHPSEQELPIYHVHGYIPRTGHIGPENKITLGENIYHQQYLDIYNWQNLVQLNKFTDKTCLFIGTSLTDPNQRRLLDIAAKQRSGQPNSHYLIKKKISEKSLADQISAYLAAFPDTLDKKQTNSISTEELANILASAYQQFDYSDAESLGIRIIWVNEFNEIPDLIRQIRGVHT